MAYNINKDQGSIKHIGLKPKVRNRLLAKIDFFSIPCALNILKSQYKELGSCVLNLDFEKKKIHKGEF